MDHLLETAIRLAAKVHKGQKDRFGKPYILHVMRVMMRGHDFEEQVLGALHDVLERSDLSAADITEKGFPPRVVKALGHITRVKEETYEAYIDRVMEDSLAIRVKLHDLACEVVAISKAGLAARAKPGAGGLIPDETHFLDALVESVETGRVPADELLEKYRGEWQGDLSRIYADYSY